MTVGPLNEENFKGLSSENQEALFALSCLSRDQRWTDAIEWTDELWEQEVIEHGKNLVSELHDGPLHTLRRALGLSNDSEIIEQEILEGDRHTRKFLAWYLEDEVSGISCETESNNTRPEPDVAVYTRNILDINIEIKRMATTSNVLEYGQSFSTNSWHEEDPTAPSILVIYFPLISVPEWRARTFVQGYRGMLKELADWRDDWMHSLMVPAPIHPDSEFHALASTKRFIRMHLNTEG